MGCEVSGFEVAGADQVFHPAKAFRKSGSSYTVWSDEVPEPVAVRYCFRNWSVGTIFNACGVPLTPFRTDDWKL
jgi:sialate O-acetylesterase